VLEDGTQISYEGELVVGTAVFVVTETEEVPAPEGTHALGGELAGVSIVVDANGVITEVIDTRAEASGDEPVEASTEEAPATEVAMSAEDVDAIVNAKLESFSAIFEGLTEMIKTIASENESLRNEVTGLKGEFDTFKSAPSNQVTETEKFARVTSTLTARQLHLRNSLNK
jgi:prophage DNA circulation protein